MGSQSVGYHQMPLETDYHTAVGRLSSQLSARPKREERVAVDNNAFGGFGGFTPEKARAQPFALSHFFFLPCANSIDFLWVSYRLSINFL